MYSAHQFHPHVGEETNSGMLRTVLVRERSVMLRVGVREVIKGLVVFEKRVLVIRTV